ncbi:hypothetical protein, partial [Escherichia coli]|uniref:hypothetical protein n=1 Tax=Escherichia coli TaxID=562 RepID=UPI0018C880D7
GFLAVLGIPAAVLGLIEGIADAIAAFTKMVSGYIADKLGHRKETRDGQARYGRGSCLPIAQLPLTRNSVSVPAAINTAASP